MLASRSGGGARREALFLLSGLLERSPARLMLEKGRRLSPDQQEEFLRRLARRARGEPLQYIEGRAAFRELMLRVDRSVLIPRPETEQLVEHVLGWARRRGSELVALDLGTGSGAIAVSLAREGPFGRVVGVDISAEALNVAGVNATAAGVTEVLDLREGSLFGALGRGERFHVIVSNPPYIASTEQASLADEVREWEPALALVAGPTGLEIISRIVEGAPGHLEPQGLLALEVSPTVAESTLELIRAETGFEEPRLLRDLAGHQRIVLAEYRGTSGGLRHDGDAGAVNSKPR